MEKFAESPRSDSDQLELDYSRKIMEQIYVFYNDQEYVDVAFNVSNPPSTVSAHRLILAAASPYFRRLFNSAEGECSVITIAGIDSDVFERLIDFCYNGKALLTTANVGYMLKGAMQLELTDAVTECANYLMKHISEYTLAKALALVNETGCEILEKRLINDYTVANFEKVSQDTVNELSIQQMQTVLLNPGMRTYDQTNLFEVIKRWYEHEKNSRELALPNLIGSLQLADFDSEFLLKKMRPLPGCANLVDEAIMGREEGNSLLVMKVFESAENVLLRYNKQEDEWVKCDVKSDALSPVKSVYFNKKIYYIAKDKAKMYSFDLQTKTRRSLPPRQNIRYMVSLVLLDDKIYVVGNKSAYNDGPMLMEMFNPSTDEWHTKADVPNARVSFGAVALNGKIFAIGGLTADSYEIAADVHSYDPKTNIWTECAPLVPVRFDHGAAVHKGQIYVIGGYSYGSDIGVMRTVERYNPERNEWTKIGSLNEAREHICGISFNSELLAIGGWNGSDYSSGIEVYDEENDNWVVKKGLPNSGEFNGYVVPTAVINSIR